MAEHVLSDLVLQDTDDDRATLNTLVERYHGKLDKLDLNERSARAQLALDLGVMMGTIIRLLREKEPGKEDIYDEP